MNQVPNINIPYEELKHLVISCIKGGSSFQFKNVCNNVGHAAVKMDLVKNPNPPNFQALYYPLQKKDENKVREIIWDLITERVLTLGDYNNDTWPWFSLTEYGEKAVNSKSPIPNDPSGYLSRIKRDIPELDSIIEIYLAESVRTYNIGQLLSSTITLGCASERALNILIETYRESFKDKQKSSSFTKKIEGKFIKTQFDEFDKSIRSQLNELTFELKEGYSNTLTGVFQMIRYNRNNAGHPTGNYVDKETLFANLQVFIPYCKYIYSLSNHLATNKHD